MLLQMTAQVLQIRRREACVTAVRIRLVWGERLGSRPVAATYILSRLSSKICML